MSNDKLFALGSVMAAAFPVALVGVFFWVTYNGYWQHVAPDFVSPINITLLVLGVISGIGTVLMVTAICGKPK